MSGKTIVFIHGLFMNPKSWSPWISHFEKIGYTCYAPAYPYHEGEPEELRKKPSAKLNNLTLDEVYKSISSFILSLPESPILIGHSMGGLIVQKLLANNIGLAGIAIDSAPPKGIVSSKWSFLKSNLPVINPLQGNTVFLPGLKWFHYAFCHLMTMEQAKASYNQLVVPESRNIPRSSAGKDGIIDFKKPHAPLLIIAGEKDHIVPAAMNKKNFLAYKANTGILNFKLFENRTHFICVQENWEEVANYIADWLSKLP